LNVRLVFSKFYVDLEVIHCVGLAYITGVRSN
jgi:hypothetical protein